MRKANLHWSERLIMQVPTRVNWFRVSWKGKLWWSPPIYLIYQTWVSLTFSCSLYWKTFPLDVDMSLKVAFFQYLQSVPPKSLLISIQSLDFTTRNWIFVKGEHINWPKSMKKVNKQCLLDTPRTVRVSEKNWQVIVWTRRRRFQ